MLLCALNSVWRNAVQNLTAEQRRWELTHFPLHGIVTEAIFEKTIDPRGHNHTKRTDRPAGKKVRDLPRADNG